MSEQEQPRKVPSLIGGAKPATAKKAAPAIKVKPTGPLRWFEVKSADKVIRQRDRTEYVIRQGKQINTGEYDVAMLQSRGVVLEEIPTPSWFAEAQQRGLEKHAELARKGIRLPEPPEYVEPELPVAAS